MAPQPGTMASAHPHNAEELPSSATIMDLSSPTDHKDDATSVPGPRTLSSLPNELQTEIARHLDSLSLCDLSLVSRHWAKIAQEELHRNPSIDLMPCATQFPRLSRLALLARTLTDCSNLAVKVRSLYIRTCPSEVDDETAIYTQYWRYRESGRSPTPVPEVRYDDEILGCVGNLQHLDLHIRSWDYRCDSIVRHIFGDGASCGLNGQPDLSDIPGLRKLKTLRLGGSKIHWEWLCLSKLCEVHIGVRCSLLNPYRSIETCHLTGLTIDRGTDLVSFDGPPDPRFKQFLEGLQNLVRLTVILCNISMDEYETPDPVFGGHINGSHPIGGAFDSLIDILAPLAPTLQQLTISECSHGDDDHYSCLEYIAPLTSLAHFEQLNTLDAPCEALVGVNQRSLFEVLPATMNRLVVHEPSADISTLLNSVPVAEELWSLAVVELRTYSSDCFEEFRYRQPDIGRHLDNAGILYHIRQWDELWFEEWDDENYDPFVCEIVNYLDSLPSNE